MQRPKRFTRPLSNRSNALESGLLRSLVNFWHGGLMDSGTIYTMPDLLNVTGALNITPHGTAATQIGSKFGLSFNFGGTTADYIDAATNNLTSTNNHTFAFWSLQTSVASDQTFYNETIAAGPYYRLHTTASGTVNWDAWGGTLTGTVALVANGWNHIAITLNNAPATAKLYINGALDVSRTSFSNTAQTIVKSTFGVYTLNPGTVQNALMLSGQLDNIGMWSRDLAADEIRLLYDRPLRMFRESPRRTYAAVGAGSGKRSFGLIL